MALETTFRASDKRQGFTVREIQALARALFEAEAPLDAHLKIQTGFGPGGLFDVRLVAVEVMRDARS